MEHVLHAAYIKLKIVEHIMDTPKALLTGFFSTVGDIECLEIVQSWLNEEGIRYDVMPYHNDIVASIPASLNKDEVHPQDYTHLIVICGPCWPSVFAEMGINLWKYEHCIRIGINLTMVKPLEEWNPFDCLLERDSNHDKRPDLSLLKQTKHVPVIGLCYIEQQNEYGDRQNHDKIFGLVNDFVKKNNYATVPIDTRWPKHRNKYGFSTSEQVISVMSRMDVIITNRLHGVVFSIKSGTPVIAIDGIKGGDKVIRQAETLNWPARETVDTLDVQKLESWFEWCLSKEAKTAIKETYKKASEQNASLQKNFTEIFKLGKKPGKIPENTPDEIKPQKISLPRRMVRKGKRTLKKWGCAR